MTIFLPREEDVGIIIILNLFPFISHHLNFFLFSLSDAMVI